MLRRSFFLSLAAGLVTSLAFAGSSHAGSVSVETFAAIVPGNAGSSATDIEITYSGTLTGPLTDIVTTGGLVGATTSISGNVVTVNFSAASSGSIDFKFTTADPSTAVGNLQLSGVVNSSLMNPIGVRGGSTVTPSVPEPSSMALLGIGMTGFLAFRRLFKRTAVA